MSYTIYAVEHTPQQMLAKYPAPAIYAEGKLYLFGESLQEIAGIEPVSIVDVGAMGFNHPFNDEAIGLTVDELNAYVDHLLSILSEGEVKLSNAQGAYLYETRFKPKGVEQI